MSCLTIRATATPVETTRSFLAESAFALPAISETPAESVLSPALQTNSPSRAPALLAPSIPSSTPLSTAAPVPLASTWTTSEFVRNSPSRPLTAPPDSTLTATTAAPPAAPPARLANQLLSASPAPLLDSLSMLREFAVLSVEMVSLPEARPAILEALTQLDASTVKSKLDMLAPDSLLTADPLHLHPLWIPLPLPLLLPLRLPRLLPLHLSRSEIPVLTPTTSSLLFKPIPPSHSTIQPRCKVSLNLLSLQAPSQLSTVPSVAVPT